MIYIKIIFFTKMPIDIFVLKIHFVSSVPTQYSVDICLVNH